MHDATDRLESLSAIVNEFHTLTSVRDEWIRDMRRAGVGVGDLVAITGLTRARIYQILEGQ